MHTSWPIGAGHPCIGCTEKHFFDQFTPFYEKLPNVPGFGIEGTAEKVGLGLVGAAAVGFGLHAGITAIRHAAGKHEEEEEHIAAFGDEPEESGDAPRRSISDDSHSGVLGESTPTPTSAPADTKGE